MEFPKMRLIEQLSVREVTAEDGQVIEELFGTNGACGGCWCMYWRLEKGGKLWEEMKGEKNRKTFFELLKSGKVKGCLAFSKNKPVGWCCFGPRADFPRFARVKALKTDWNESTWSVVCFYIPAKFRREGVATRLLEYALVIAKKERVSLVEAYPAPDKWAKKGTIPGAFAWTGTTSLFTKFGFEDCTPEGNSRPILKLQLD